MADPECGAALSPPPPVHDKAQVVANRTKPPEASRFFLNDAVAFIYVYVDDNAYSNRIHACIKETQSIIIPSVNVSSKIFIG